MAHFRDLAPCTYFGPTRIPLLAVGWLEAGHEVPPGPIPPEDVLTKLAEMLEVRSSYGFLGWHDCDLCRLGVGPRLLRFMLGSMSSSVEVEMGIRNLFVPAKDVAYVAPSLIFHSVDSHGYGPPLEFIEAVRACPEPKSAEYAAAVQAIFRTAPTP